MIIFVMTFGFLFFFSTSLFSLSSSYYFCVLLLFFLLLFYFSFAFLSVFSLVMVGLVQHVVVITFFKDTNH